MAARGRNILITANPQGRFLEGTIYGTPKPGTVMEIKDAFYEGNQHRWQAFSASSGERRMIAVLLEDKLQGKTVDDAYVSGTRGFLYCPIMGEELNMLIADVAGTADTHAALEMLRVQTATGLLIASASSPESEPFQLLQAISVALTTDTLYPCMYTGQ